MSLSTRFSQSQQVDVQSIVDQRGAEILRALRRDLAILEGRMTRKSIVSPFTPLRGEYDKAKGILTYKLLRQKDFINREALLGAWKTTATNLRYKAQSTKSSDFLRALHEFCAQSAVNTRIELDAHTGPYFKALDTCITVYTREPYKASSNLALSVIGSATVPLPSVKDQLTAHIEQLDDAAARKLLESLTNPPQPAKTAATNTTAGTGLTKDIILRAPRLPVFKPSQGV